MKAKFMAALLLLGMGWTFAACGSDDDDDSQGSREVAELKAMLLDNQGQIAFDATESKGYYQVGLFSLDDAREIEGNAKLQEAFELGDKI